MNVYEIFVTDEPLEKTFDEILVLICIRIWINDQFFHFSIIDR